METLERISYMVYTICKNLQIMVENWAREVKKKVGNLKLKTI